MIESVTDAQGRLQACWSLTYKACWASAKVGNWLSSGHTCGYLWIPCFINHFTPQKQSVPWAASWQSSLSGSTSLAKSLSTQKDQGTEPYRTVSSAGLPTQQLTTSWPPGLPYCIILLHLHIWIRSVFVLCGLGSTLCLWWPQLQRATSPLLLLYHITATLVAQQQLGSLGVAHVAHIPRGTITLQTSHLGIGDNDNWQQVAVRPSHRCRGSRRAWQGSRAQGNPDGWQRRLLETPAKSKSQICTYQIKLHSCITYI